METPNMETYRKYGIPENIGTFLDTYVSNIEISLNTVDGINGYGGPYLIETVKISMYQEKCLHCPFDSVFNPMGEGNSTHHRHTLTRDYADVFVWSGQHNEYSLKEAFDIWLEENPKKNEWYKPKKKMKFGKIGR